MNVDEGIFYLFHGQHAFNGHHYEQRAAGVT